jgi:hypothetical protein
MKGAFHGAFCFAIGSLAQSLHFQFDIYSVLWHASVELICCWIKMTQARSTAQRTHAFTFASIGQGNKTWKNRRTYLPFRRDCIHGEK